MAKRNKKQNIPAGKPQHHEPVPTRRSFLAAFWLIVSAFVIQIAMAVAVYRILPSEIPSGWVGWVPPGGTVPSWVVFLAFPGATAVVLVLAWFSQVDSQGRKAMEFGKAVSLIVLTALFTALQASAFFIQR